MNINKDHINVHPSTVNHGGNGPNGKGYIVREWARDLRIDDFNPQQGDMLIFDNSLGVTSQEELANLITNINIEADNFIVNFGDNVTMTMAGVQQPDQISWDNVIVGDPDATDSDVDDPVAGDPDATDSDVDDPVAGDPDATDSDVDDPVAGDPDATDSDTDDSVAGDPNATDSDVDDSVAGDPDTTDSDVDDPVAGDPDATDSDTDDSVAADSGQDIDTNPGEIVQGEEGSENFIFHDLGHWTINDFNPSEDMLVFTEYDLTREEIAAHITNIDVEAENFIVNFGDDVSITLVGQSPTWDNVTTIEG